MALINFSSDKGIAIGTSPIAVNNTEIFPNILSVKTLNLQSNNLVNNSSQSDADGNNQLILTDSNNKTIGCFGNHFYDNKYQALSMFSKKETDSEEYYNGLHLGIDSNGNPVVTMRTPACKKAWHTALEPNVLYDYGGGTLAYPITLSASAANYEHMRIYYSDTLICSSVDVINPNGKSIDLFLGAPGNDSGFYYPKATQVEVHETTLRIAGDSPNYTYYMDTQGASSTVRTTYYHLSVYVYRVEAW